MLTFYAQACHELVPPEVIVAVFSKDVQTSHDINNVILITWSGFGVIKYVQISIINAKNVEFI